MATKLSLYNGALRLCKERRLASLSENREPRRLLDDAYDGSVARCLELGQWTFATRAQRIDYSPSVEPDFGYRRAFDQPIDMVRVTAVCSDEYYNSPLLQYSDERRYWYADLDTIYVRFVSNDTGYGMDLSLWPESFAKLVEADLANEVVGNLTGADPDKVAKQYKIAKADARALDAMNQPTVFTPAGGWSSARRGNSRGPRSGRSQLIG